MSAITVPEAFDLALQHHRAGRLAEAEALYGEILSAEPNHVGALHFRGVIAHQTGRHDEAIQWIGRAIALEPNIPAAHSNLGEVYRAIGRLDEAAAAYRRALDLKPGYTPACSNLGVVLTEQGQLDEAIATLRHALETDPTCAEAANNLGNALVELGRLDEAIAAFAQAIALQPDYASPKFGQSMLWLLKGEFGRGWPLYEARLEVFQAARRNFPQPRWSGAPLQHRRVLVHAEQGFGDAIQFMRYVPLIAGSGGEVIVECPGPLTSLFRGASNVREVVATGDPLPAFDLQVPMLSLPLIFGTTIESIPRVVPYIFAEPARREAWRERLGGDGHRRKVGLAWAGNRTKPLLRKRHIALEQLLPLLRVEGVDFFSLQIEAGTQQIQQCAPVAKMKDLTGQIDDFADTAAMMMELDLIISVDTASAHLAGALGRPVWTLLPFVPDWRWGLEGETTPWYPTMRLFRQPGRGDWDSVVERVAGELTRWADNKAPRRVAS